VSDPVEGTGSHPFILGIIGDSGSGKSTVAAAVRMLIGPDRVSSLELDSYHRHTRAERLEKGLTALNPAVHDFGLMQEHLALFRRGRPVRARSYDHSDGTFGSAQTIEPAEVVIVRGLLGFPTDELRGAYDLAVFLQPEPELLFRWKLRRDVKTRGYTEAGVLKHIAQHLLDSKEYVLPQAERADLVVCYSVPEWDAPDDQVQVTLVLRRAAAEVARDAELERFNGHVQREDDTSAGELRLTASPGLPLEAVDGWVAELFPAATGLEQLGSQVDDAGETHRLAPLAFAEVMIAALTRKLVPAALPGG
jgi:uridine kinase